MLWQLSYYSYGYAFTMLHSATDLQHSDHNIEMSVHFYAIKNDLNY